jgi:YYY domain-containing protein
MTAFLSWYVLLTLLGLLTFPLGFYLFPALADRGYTLARAFGLLIWGYVFWLFASFRIAQNDIGGLLLGLLVLGGLSSWAFLNCRTEIEEWFRANRRLIVTTEGLFLFAFGLMAFVRAANPEIVGTEKPMELMFINGTMNSPTFPPRDLWLSGYSISYYYFGYVMASMLATFTGVPATMAFNLMISLIFGLSAVGAYGILYNLLANYHEASQRNQLTIREHGQSPVSSLQPPVSADQSSTVNRQSSNLLSSFLSPLLAPLFLLIISNVEGFLEVLHVRGFLWKEGSNFWTWLDIPELRDAPTQTAAWVPDRFWWWWRASRVIQDYELNGTFREVIDEFPFFSYLLGDLHPHVLAMPFNLLAIAVALNIFFGGWRGRMNLWFGELRINKAGFFTVALVLGGLAFLNTWDILIGGALIVFSYVLAQVRESGWGWERLEDLLLLGFPAVITAFLLYLPFYIGFDSQLGGVIPNFMFVTRGAHLWVMWGTLFLPLFAFLIYVWRNGTPAAWRTSLFTALGILIVLLLGMFAIGLLALRLKPDIALPLLQSQGRDVSAFIVDSMARRLTHIGGLLTLLALFIPALAFLLRSERNSSSFVLLMIALGALLIIGPEFLYLRDNFGYRINTIFKFYYQAWIVLSLAAAYASIVLLRNLRGAANVAFSILFALLLVVGLTYPALSIFNKTNNFKPPSGYTLDDFDRVQRENPDEAAAIEWLRSAPDGVVAEAVGGAYSSYARVSIYTGLPTVLGWGNHEGQWRDQALQGSRQSDIETLYTTNDWVTTQDILNRYSIRYVFVGGLERSTYRVNEEKFNRLLNPVFQQGSVIVYEVP